jgi:hypothetical protein
MRAREYLRLVRAHYLAAFRHEVEKLSAHKRGSNDRVLLEGSLSIEKDGKTIPLPGELSLPYRFDVAVATADGRLQPTMIVADHDIPWQPSSIAVGDLDVRVDHFLWNVCSITARPAPPRSDWSRLRDWFVDWFNRENEGESLAGSFRFDGVVHFMSDPEVVDDTIAFQLDLGSAPAEALEQLFVLLADMGAREAEVYTSEGALDDVAQGGDGDDDAADTDTNN